MVHGFRPWRIILARGPLAPWITVARSPGRCYQYRPASNGHYWLCKKHLSTSTSRKKSDGRANSVQLRPYQEDSIQAVLDFLQKGERRLGLSLATGSGKTVIFSHLIDRVAPPSERAVQTLILAHRQELVEQAAMHCRKTYPEMSVEVEMAGARASGFAEITVASIASLIAGTRLDKYDPARFKLIIVDEAHHIVSRSYLAVLGHFGLMRNARQSHIALLGVSATFSRTDGLSLGKAIDHIVYHNDYVDMIEAGWLSNVIFTTVRSGADVSKVKTGAGDFLPGSLSTAVNTVDVNTVTVRAWLKKAGSRKSTLVFCVDLAHVTALTAMFRQHGIDARYVTGSTPRRIRKERTEAFKSGEFPVLLNCGVFTEGTDLPNIDCVVLARPTKSRNLLIQMIGRGMRKFTGKGDCHIIDMVATLKTGIASTPTLFGLDPDELVDEADVEAMRSTKEREPKKVVRAQLVQSHGPPPELKGKVTFTDYDSVHELLDDTSGERHIRAASPFAWVQVDEGRYVLCSTTGDLTITSTDDRHLVTFRQRLKEQGKGKSPFTRPRQIVEASTFHQAVAAADNFAKAKFVVDMIKTKARWRAQPASDQQVAYLNKFRKGSEKLKPGDISKGRAADWITKLKHGAKGRVAHMGVEKRRAERVVQQRERFNEAQRRAQVQVGPVS